MNRQQRMEAVLRTAFAPEQLEIRDDSASHAGHVGARPGGETHYAVHIVSKQFEGMSRIAQHRAVQQALAAEFESGLHALVINASAPVVAQEKG